MRILIESGCLEDRYEVDTYYYYYWCLLLGLVPWGHSASQSDGFVDEAVCRTIEDLGFIWRQKQEIFSSFMELGPTLGSPQPPLRWLLGPFPRG
jgi:hypothetical protein